MSNRLLPAVKRYAVSTEPVREAAKVNTYVIWCLRFAFSRVESSFGLLFMKKLLKYEFQRTTTFRCKNNNPVQSLQTTPLNLTTLQRITAWLLRKVRSCLARVQCRPPPPPPRAITPLTPLTPLTLAIMSPRSKYASSRKRPLLHLPYMPHLRRALKGRDTNARANRRPHTARYHYQLQLRPNNSATRSMIHSTYWAECPRL